MFTAYNIIMLIASKLVHTLAHAHTHTQKQWYGAGSRGIVRDRMSFAVHFNRNGKCWNSRWSCARSTITAYENALEISWTSSNMKREHTFESYWRRTKTRNSSNRRYDVTWLSKIKAIRQYVMAFWGARHTQLHFRTIVETAIEIENWILLA